jgi:hypothetical protein
LLPAHLSCAASGRSCRKIVRILFLPASNRLCGQRCDGFTHAQSWPRQQPRCGKPLENVVLHDRFGEAPGYGGIP